MRQPKKTSFYQNSYQANTVIELKKRHIKEQIVKWFNKVTVGKESFTNVMRFEEIEYVDGCIAKDETGKEKRFKTEWLSSVHVSKGNCFILAKLGRMRADREDLHNSLKNRGFCS